MNPLREYFEIYRANRGTPERVYRLARWSFRVGRWPWLVRAAVSPLVGPATAWAAWRACVSVKKVREFGLGPDDRVEVARLWARYRVERRRYVRDRSRSGREAQQAVEDR